MIVCIKFSHVKFFFKYILIEKLTVIKRDQFHSCSIIKDKESIEKLLSSLQQEGLSFMNIKKQKLLEIEERRNIRKNKKTVVNKYTSSHVNLQIIGNGKIGNSSCLYLFSDHFRCMFNCGEGTQRLCSEYKIKISLLDHVFITKNSWKNLGGLPGLVLTVFDMGVPEITIHSSPGIEDLFENIKHFVPVEGMKVSHNNILENEFKNNTLNIQAIPLKSSLNKQCETSLAFVCTLPPRKGSLLPEKCLELGVNPGPDFAKLKLGMTVVLSNGTVIKPSDCCEPDDPEYVFVVLECPNKDYFASLKHLSDFLKLQESDTRKKLLFIAHFTPFDVMRNEVYKEWMETFSNDTDHIILNELCPDNGSISIHKMQYKLNVIDPIVFPLLCYSNTNCIKNIDEVRLFRKEFIIAQTMMKYYLWPNRRLDKSGLSDISFEEYDQEINNIEGLFETINEFKKKINFCENKSIKEYPKIVFLGTGSSIPNKARNTSGILMHVTESTAILLDCGEGTLNQMHQYFGPDLYKVLLNLKAVYISHMHADHHIGLLSIILARINVYTSQNCPLEPLFIFAPKNIMLFLEYYNKIEPFLSHVIFICNADLLNTSSILLSETILETLELSDLITTYVIHCPQSFGVKLVTKENFSIVYSGDCIPDRKLVQLGLFLIKTLIFNLKIGLDCNLLIHEATMEDGLEEEARCKMHSTLSQAINISMQMKAQFAVLTHFSQRYARIPMIGKMHTNSNVGIAYDFMTITPKDLYKLPYYYPVFLKLFNSYYQDLQDRVQRRENKKFLIKNY